MKNFTLFVLLFLIGFSPLQSLASPCSDELDSHAIQQDQTTVLQILGQMRTTNSIQSKLSYHEFEKVILTAVTRAPEMGPLWKWRNKKANGKKKDTFLAGEGLWHFLSFINFYLSKNSAKQLLNFIESKSFSFEKAAQYMSKHSHPAALSKNQSSPGLWEIIVPNGYEDQSTYSQPLREETDSYYELYLYDVIPERDHVKRLRLGGPTLQNVRVNPDRIDDPSNALRAYYDGRLDFNFVPASEYWSNRVEGESLYFNLRSDDAIRTMQILFASRQLRMSPQEIQQLATSVKEDFRVLEPGNLDFLEIGIPAGSMGSSIGNLNRLAGKNWIRTLKLLTGLGVVDFLRGVNAQFFITPDPVSDAYTVKESLRKQVQKMKRAGFSEDNVRNICLVFPPYQRNLTNRSNPLGYFDNNIWDVIERVIAEEFATTVQ